MWALGGRALFFFFFFFVGGGGGGGGGARHWLLHDISLAPKLFAKLIVAQAINQIRVLDGNRLPARLQDPFT